MVVPMLRDLELDFAGRTFTADAPLTRRKLADFLRRRGAHFLFTAKDNQPTLLDDLRAFFDNRGEPDFREPARLEHGRVESRAIWTIARLNGHPTFPHVGQAFLVERAAVDNTTRPRRLAIGVVRARGNTCVTAATRRLNRNMRLVFYLRMTKNSLGHPSTPHRPLRIN